MLEEHVQCNKLVLSKSSLPSIDRPMRVSLPMVYTTIPATATSIRTFSIVTDQPMLTTHSNVSYFHSLTIVSSIAHRGRLVRIFVTMPCTIKAGRHKNLLGRIGKNTAYAREMGGDWIIVRVIIMRTIKVVAHVRRQRQDHGLHHVLQVTAIPRIAF